MWEKQIQLHWYYQTKLLETDVIAKRFATLQSYLPLFAISTKCNQTPQLKLAGWWRKCTLKLAYHRFSHSWTCEKELLNVDPFLPLESCWSFYIWNLHGYNLISLVKSTSRINYRIMHLNSTQSAVLPATNSGSAKSYILMELAASKTQTVSTCVGLNHWFNQAAPVQVPWHQHCCSQVKLGITQIPGGTSEPNWEPTVAEKALLFALANAGRSALSCPGCFPVQFGSSNSWNTGSGCSKLSSLPVAIPNRAKGPSFHYPLVV